MSSSSTKSKRAITVRLDAELVDRLRTFCRDQAGKPLYATVNGIVAQAITNELERLSAEIEGGGRRTTETSLARRLRPSRNGLEADQSNTPLNT